MYHRKVTCQIPKLYEALDDEVVLHFLNDQLLTLQVDGKMKLRGSHADRYRSLNTTGENQWLPSQNHNVTYITRLQALQAAVDHQLEQLSKDHPTRKAALISFNSEVITCLLLVFPV